MRYAAAIILAVMLTALSAGLLQAQEPERYRLEKTEGGYVRMDTQTGAMSICKERGDQLVCRLAADARSAYDDSLQALQTKVEALENRVTALENGKVGKSAGLPTDEEVDRTLGIMERFFRRFMGVMKDFENEMRNDEPTTATPDRT